MGKTVLKISKLVMYDVCYNTFLKEAFLRAMSAVVPEGTKHILNSSTQATK